MSDPFALSLYTETLSIGDINDSRDLEAAPHSKPFTNKLSLIDKGIPSKKPIYFLWLYLFYASSAILINIS